MVSLNGGSHPGQIENELKALEPSALRRLGVPALALGVVAGVTGGCNSNRPDPEGGEWHRFEWSELLPEPAPLENPTALPGRERFLEVMERAVHDPERSVSLGYNTEQRAELWRYAFEQVRHDYFSPTNLEGLEWRLAAHRTLLDLETVNGERFHQQSVEDLDTYFSSLGGLSDVQPFADFAARMEMIFELRSLSPKGAARERCEQEIERLEQEISSRVAQGLDLDITSLLETATENEGVNRRLGSTFLSERAEADPTTNLSAENRLRVVQALEESPHFSLEDGAWVFRPPSEAGAASDRWNVIHRSLKGQTRLLFQNAEEPDIFFDIATYFMLVRDFETHLASRAERAEQERLLEISGAETAAEYDLPKDRQGCFLRFVQSDYDSAIHRLIPSTSVLAAAIERRYENISVPPIEVTNTPLQSLQAAVQREYEAGRRHFVAEFCYHGSTDDLGKDDRVSGGELLELAKQYPDASFDFMTIACHGGNLRESMLEPLRNDPDLASRVNLFTRTEADSLNFGVWAGEFEQRKEHFGIAALTMAMAERLLSDEMTTFGEAFYAADQMIREAIYLDPEAIINGELISFSPDTALAHRRRPLS